MSHESKGKMSGDTLLNVVVLTTRLPEDIWLINKISSVCRIAGIIFPAGTRYREYGIKHVLLKRTRRSGIHIVLNQALLVLYRFFFEGWRDKKAFTEIFNDSSLCYCNI